MLRPMNRSETTSLEEAYALAYRELRARAGALGGDGSISPTTLVHEAFERLAHLQDEAGWTPLRVRAVAAKAMHSVLVDRVRARRAAKRGGGWQRVTLADVSDGSEVDLIELHDALTRLSAEDETAFRIVELRFFGGLSTGEIATVLELSPRTVERRWRAARALLRSLIESA